ncbi:MAG: hypothetical protein ACOC22_02490 [bacterium]
MTKWTLDNVYEELKKEEVTPYTVFSYSHPIKTKNKIVNLTLGKIWWNIMLPEDFRLIKKPVDKEVADSLINEIADKYDTKTASETISLIQKEAFKFSSFQPSSFLIDAFIPSDKWKIEKRKFQEEAAELSNEEYEKRKKDLVSKLMDEMNEKGIPIQNGIRGKTGKINTGVWETLQVSKGNTIDIEGNVKRIVKGNADGFDISDYYTGAGEARRGFFYKSTAVQDPGYLARKIVMACSNLELKEKDCKTRKYLNLFVDSQKAKTLHGRYFLNENGELEVIKNPKQIVNKTIKLRSPIWCKTKDGLCETCYGELAKKLETERVGILAGGAVNDEAVNAMMKLRHETEQVKMINVDFQETTKKSTVDHTKLSYYLDIRKHEIIAKQPVSIFIDLRDYKNEVVDTGEKFQIPGILNITVGEGEDIETITLPYKFTVDLYKPANTEERGNQIRLLYQPNERMIYKEQYVKEIDPKVISKMFDGLTRYIEEPGVLLESISNELTKTDSVHIETIISHMFRSKDDPETPGRLVNYKNTKIFGVKDLPYIDSWTSALAFEDINKAIKSGLISEKESQQNPIERRLIASEYGD